MPSLADDPNAVKAMDSAALMKRRQPESKWFKTKAAKLLSKKCGHGLIGLKIPHWVGHYGLRIGNKLVSPTKTFRRLARHIDMMLQYDAAGQVASDTKNNVNHSQGK